MYQIDAILDSSFWSLASRLNLESFIYLLFARPLLCPYSVKQEIDPASASAVIYPYQQRFRVAVEDERITVVEDPATPYPKFGRGEAAAIQMALEHRKDATEPVVLINDYRPYMEVTDRLGMAAMSVPELAVALVASGIRTPSAALLDLDAMRDNTSEDLIGLAEKAIRALI